jgi:hypothetical protein
MQAIEDRAHTLQPRHLLQKTSSVAVAAQFAEVGVQVIEIVAA